MIIRRWTMVIMGALFTIISAFMSNFLIAQNNDAIERFTSSAKELERSIDNTWQNTIFLNQKYDTAVVMMNLTQNKNSKISLQSFVIDTLNETGIDPEKTEFASNQEAFDYLKQEIDLYKRNSLGKINELYYNKLQEEADALSIKNKNMTYANIALLLQLLGLILVLSKDLLRK